jgi:hypothetical protein
MKASQIVYLLGLAALGAMHAFTTDATAQSLFSPAVKGVLSVMAYGLAALMPAFFAKAAAKAAVVASGALVLLSLIGCANPPAPATVVNAVLTAEQVACVLAQVELGQAEPGAVATVCKISADLIPDLKTLLDGAHKAGLGKAAQNETRQGLSPLGDQGDSVRDYLRGLACLRVRDPEPGGPFGRRQESVGSRSDGVLCGTGSPLRIGLAIAHLRHQFA